MRDVDIRGITGRRVHYLTVHTEPGVTSRLNGIYTFKPYVYRGTGYDTLTAWMDDEPEELPSARQARLEMLAELRLAGNTGRPDPGTVTAQEAAEMLGVTVRTIERYKRDLRRTS